MTCENNHWMGQPIVLKKSGAAKGMYLWWSHARCPFRGARASAAGGPGGRATGLGVRQYSPPAAFFVVPLAVHVAARVGPPGLCRSCSALCTGA